jgi:hypothetical protein
MMLIVYPQVYFGYSGWLLLEMPLQLVSSANANSKMVSLFSLVLHQNRTLQGRVNTICHQFPAIQGMAFFNWILRKLNSLVRPHRSHPSTSLWLVDHALRLGS